MLHLHGFREGLNFFCFHQSYWNFWDLFMHLALGSPVSRLLFSAPAKATSFDFLRSPFVQIDWPRKGCNHDVFCLLVLLVSTRVCPFKCSSVALNMLPVLPPMSNSYRKADFGSWKNNFVGLEDSVICFFLVACFWPSHFLLSFIGSGCKFRDLGYS